MNEEYSSWEDFSGTVRLFPLPNLVLFPHVVQPLHIFEPRYRQLMADALESDRLMALALLEPGWEQNYHKRPAIHPVVCIGKIFKEERLADGRYNLLLHGQRRARVVEECEDDRLYRSARVELLTDVEGPGGEQEAAMLRELGQHLSVWFASQGLALEQLSKLLESGLTLGALCDIFTFALPLNIEFKQQLLDQVDVETRTRRLLDHLEEHAPGKEARPAGKRFPPEFSRN
jgi:Lon protease-like protein